MNNWNPLVENRTLNSVDTGGVRLAPGDRVRLRPLGRADIFDIALDGKTATILSIEQDYEDRVYLAVTIDDDPGSDLGEQGKPAHRFFFGLEEVESLSIHTAISERGDSHDEARGID